MQIKKIIIPLGISALFITLSNPAFASAFQSFEQNASGLGNAYSGMAAIADDATTEFYNPAGLTRIKRQEVDVSTVVADASSDFTATRATSNSQNVLTSPGTHIKSNPLGMSPLPAVHYAKPLMDNLVFGFGITIPFGLETDYGDDSAARYMATDSKIITVNISPSLAYQITEKLSVGAGLDAQYITAELDQQVDPSQFLGGAPTTANDLTMKNSADDWGFGWNAGILYQFSPHTRAGLSYRSSVKHSPSGKSKVTYPNTLDPSVDIPILEANGLKDGNVSTDMTLPETATLSLYHEFTSRWAAMASATFTHWQRFKKLTLHFTGGLADTSVIENFHDTLRYAAGVNYRVNKKLLLRAGAAYDESPTNSARRTIRLPDADRQWLSLGAHYEFNKHASLDAGGAYIHIDKGTVSQTGLLGADIDGKFRHTCAGLFGAQFNWVFG
jgi:long-chain fatty acid transport protein